jgi:uncharacterized protein involved in response to NO
MQRSLRVHDAMPERTSRPRLALAAKGFRPFFLLAALFAAAIVPTWILIVLGVVPPGVYFDGVTWHAHEMVFGFTVAVIAGFLLTAVGNWTKRETLVGAPLLGLAGLWVSGRLVLLLAAFVPHAVVAAVDLAFLPVLGAVLARPLLATKNRRNYVMLALVVALFAADLGMHLDALHLAPPGTAQRAVWVAIDLVVVMMLIMAGRIVPMFTRNATGIASIRSIPSLDVAAPACAAALAVADAVAWQSTASAVIAGAAAVATLARTARWGTLATARHPLLWILHAGHAWIAVGLGLRVLSLVRPVASASLAVHALTVGAIGSLTLGMMARVALGHTGRSLAVGRTMSLAFVLVTVAAVARAIVPMFAPARYMRTLEIAASLWSLAFLLYVVVYLPVLLSPRADGKAG